MASIFGSPLFTSPLTKLQFSSSNYSSSQTPPPQQTPPPSPQPETPLPTVAQPITTKRPTQPKPKTTTTTTTAESTDWIASTLTRRFGLGAGLAWVGFLAFGVVSEQIKTRLEVSQQEANTNLWPILFTENQCNNVSFLIEAVFLNMGIKRSATRVGSICPIHSLLQTGCRLQAAEATIFVTTSMSQAKVDPELAQDSGPPTTPSVPTS
ncbi:Peptidyl-prolyl cis-trans isomerase FKBP17-2 [Cinnamomum micranthum f. kanehirae]|uniref:Peptidyl-prolyl cis-trans isomerase FKBP17-2 n=1 Tax=Cinnamomum micranthum f. kanehirae TaxID=337451 RepID=A0A443NF48_9MAGN|nr:Peptidyl-prolyl cis-trans isomerase FKBP17-2 [Cinnamomum micranthum f. kanehirae]